MPERRVRVYCSGQIFNESERDETKRSGDLDRVAGILMGESI